jgi:hypothetical protein
MTREELEKAQELQKAIDEASGRVNVLLLQKTFHHLTGETGSGPCSVYIPDDLAAGIKPMIRQYWEDKKRAWEAELAAL